MMRKSALAVGLGLAIICTMLIGCGVPRAATSSTALSPTATATPKPAIANVYYRTSDHVVSALNPADGSVRWTLPQDKGFGTPIASGNFAYVQALGQNVILSALDSATSAVVWSAPIGTPPQIANGCVYTIVTQGLECLDAATGKIQWLQPAQNKGSLKLIGDTIYVDSAVGSTIDATGMQDITSSTLTALSSTNGSTRWSFTREHVQFTFPDVRNGVVYFEATTRPDSSPPTGQIYALKDLDGSQLWSSPAPGIANAFAVTDSVYFVGGSATGIAAYRTSDGALLWKNTDPMLSRFTAVGNTVYINTFRGSVLALASDTGKQVWETQVGGPGGVPIVTSGVLYVAAGRGAGQVVALNTSTGAIAWRAPVAGTPSALILAGGMIFTNDSQPDNGPSPKVYAFNASDGTNLWQHQTKLYVASTVTVPDGQSGA